VLIEPGYAFRGGRIVTERSAARVMSFEIDGKRRQGFSIGSSEQFALLRFRPAGAGGAAVQVPLTDVRRILDAQARRIQRSRAQPSVVQAIRSDVVAVARDAGGRKLAAVHLTGGDPYSFTAPILAWAAGTAAVHGVRSAGALGPVEAFGLDNLESACAGAGFSREPAP